MLHKTTRNKLRFIIGIEKDVLVIHESETLKKKFKCRFLIKEYKKARYIITMINIIMKDEPWYNNL